MIVFLRNPHHQSTPQLAAATYCTKYCYSQ